MRNEAPRLSSLDALRGWAILSVMMVHAGLIVAPESAWLRLPTSQGGRGVELFYIVSAFSLMNSYVVSQTAGRPFLLGEYALRRVFRIGPMWWLAILLYCWVYSRLLNWDVAILSVIFSHGFHHRTLYAVPGGWSIAVEAVFYCLLPIIFVLVTNIGRAVALLCVSVVISYFASDWIYALLIAEGVPRDNAIAFAYQLSFPIQFPVFCLGVLIFHAWNEAGRPRGAWGIAFIALGFVTVLLASRLDRVWIFDSVFTYSVGFALAVFGLVVSPNALLDNPVTRHIGKVSYSIYLLHFALLVVLQNFADWFALPRTPSNIGYLIGYLMLVLLATAAATVTYYVVELPFMRWSHRPRRLPDAPRPDFAEGAQRALRP